MLKVVTETEGLEKFSKAERRVKVAKFCNKKSAMQYGQGRNSDNKEAEKDAEDGSKAQGIAMPNPNIQQKRSGGQGNSGS